MTQFLTIFGILLILFLCGSGFIGCYYLVNDNAVRAWGDALVGASSDAIDAIGRGFFYVLAACAVSIFLVGLGYGLRAGAKPTGAAAAMLIVAPAIREAIAEGRPACLGDWHVGQPVDKPSDAVARLFLPDGDVKQLPPGDWVRASDGSWVRYGS